MGVAFRVSQAGGVVSIGELMKRKVTISMVFSDCEVGGAGFLMESTNLNR